MATNPRFVDLLIADTVHGRAKNLRSWITRHPNDPLTSELMILSNRYEDIASEILVALGKVVDVPTWITRHPDDPLAAWITRHPNDPLTPELMILSNRYEDIAREMWDLVEPWLDAPTPEGA